MREWNKGLEREIHTNKTKKLFVPKTDVCNFITWKCTKEFCFIFSVKQRDFSNHTYFHRLGNNTLPLGLLKVWHFLFASWKQYSSSVIRNTYKNIFQLEFISRSKSKFQLTVTFISTIFFICYVDLLKSALQWKEAVITNIANQYHICRWHCGLYSIAFWIMWVILHVFVWGISCIACKHVLISQ